MPDIILIVEDEPHMGTILQDYFAAHGVESDLASDGDTALDAFARRDYDAVLLDVMIPGLDGYGVCRAIRRESSLPILFLTALGGEEQALYGYSLGADDYVTKPFSLALLLAKTTALIRRSRGTEDGALICGAIRLEPGPMLCTVSHNQVKLSPREYQLLLCLLRNRGKVLSREQLLTRVWGWDFESFPPCDFWWKLSEDGSTQRKPKSCGILRILASVFRFYLNPQGFPSSSHFCPEL